MYASLEFAKRTNIRLMEGGSGLGPACYRFSQIFFQGIGKQLPVMLPGLAMASHRTKALSSRQPQHLCKRISSQSGDIDDFDGACM